MRNLKREIASCIATLEWMYDQIPELTASQIQIHLHNSIDQQSQLLSLLDSIGEDKISAGSQLTKQLEDLRAIQRKLLQKLASRFSVCQSTASQVAAIDSRCSPSN